MADGKSTYEIDIKTAADLKAAEAYKRAIESAQKAAREAGKESNELSKRLEGVDKALQGNAARSIKLAENLKTAQAGAKALGQDTSALAQEIKALGVYGEAGGGFIGFLKSAGVQMALVTGTSLAAAAAVKVVAEAIRSYADKEDQLNAMQVALSSQGKYSKEAATGIAELADKYEGLTNVDSGKWLEAFTRLIQYGGKSSEIGKLGETLKNLTGIMGGDMDGAASLMIRALNGSFKGFERLGFVVDKNASDMDKWLSIVQQSERGAGAMESRIKTLSGAFEGYKVGVSNFLTNFGQWLDKHAHLSTLLQFQTAIFTTWAEKLGFTIPQVAGLTNATSELNKSLEDGGESAERHRERLKRMGDEADRAAKKIDAIVKAIDSLKKQDDDEATAKMNFDLAVVDDREKSGSLSKLGAERQRYGIRSQFARGKNQRDNSADFAALSLQNQRAGQLSKGQETYRNQIAYLDHIGDKSGANRLRDDFAEFNTRNTTELASIGNSSLERWNGMQSRNNVYAFDSATSAVKNNTGQRVIMDEMAKQVESNLQGGRGAGVFKDLADKSAYIPDAINTAAGVGKLLGELVRVYGVTGEQVRQIQADMNAMTQRDKANRFKQ